MDINLSPVAVSGRRRPTTNNKPTSSTTTTTTSARIKPSQSCHSCSDDQHSFTSDDREKSLNSCFTDNDSSNQRHHHHHSHLQGQSSLHHHHFHEDEQNLPERDLDSPDQDYDFNSRFSPPPTDNSYHSENHCQCYGHDDAADNDTDSEPDFIGSGVESGRTRRTAKQFRQKRRGHRNCTMGEDDELVVAAQDQDTVCIIESEARGGVSSARELNEKTMASKARQGTKSHQVGGVGGLSPAAKSYHNICGAGSGGGRSYEIGKNGQSANFGAVSGSGGGNDVACGKLLDKVCINNGCSGACCNKRPPTGAQAGGVGVSAVGTGLAATMGNNRSNRKASGPANNNLHPHPHQGGINEFMHGPTPGAAMQLASYGPQMKWTRSNIAATMERYEPSTSSSSVSPCHSPNHSRPCTAAAGGPPSRHLYHFSQGQQPGAHNANFQHDYSYAYYEPGAAMRHANIPGSPVAGPSSSHVTPNSIQALLLKSHGYQAKLKKQAAVAAAQSASGGAGPSRHAYTTRYGTQENIYEEIGNEDRMRMMMAASSNGHSMVSLNQSMVEEEFRQVHNRHRRILGELNLSVEAMIMPLNPPVEPVANNNNEEGDSVVPEGSPAHSEVKSVRGKMNEFVMKPIRNPAVNVQMTRGCPVDALSGGDCSQINGDMDSGFSGSSSGASYVGSLRYQKSQCCGPSGALMARGQRAYEDPGMMSFSTRSSSSYGSSKSSHNLQRIARSAEDPGPSSGIHHHHAAMALNGMPGTSATLKPMSKNASFWSRKGWKIIPGLTSPGGSKTTNVLSG